MPSLPKKLLHVYCVKCIWLHALHVQLGIIFFGVCLYFSRCHLQALRHLYVLAVEPRLIIPRDVDTRAACYVPVEITLKVCESPHELVMLQCMITDEDTNRISDLRKFILAICVFFLQL